MVFVLMLCFGFITALIAASKGRSATPWFIYGMLLAVVAIPHALLLPR